MIIKSLEEELKSYEERLGVLLKEWSESKEGSRYGNEYLETQIKVHQAMVADIKKQILEEKGKK